MRVDDAVCGGCGFQIRERFLLKVMDEFWHESCLSCSTCHLRLSDNSSCFIKDGHVYCREDHAQLVLHSVVVIPIILITFYLP
ncbi:unnamed protein product [Anisakis simplex]|uniref:LIM zinc-binding domain-containing protein n=1 Tax=Anisakis simplex TaxID=6269 RepID=A0A0M3J202_ANISI|nr:unnamed protein product [Anisakis simplex]